MRQGREFISSEGVMGGQREGVKGRRDERM